jgi:hypothetical protein
MYRLSIRQSDDMQPQYSIRRCTAVPPFEKAPDHPADPERDNEEQRDERECLKALAEARLGLVASHKPHANHATDTRDPAAEGRA